MVWPTPLKNMSQIGSSSQLLGKIKFMFQNVPNHQPDTLELLTYSNIQRWLTKNWDTKDPTDGFLGKRSTLTSPSCWALRTGDHFVLQPLGGSLDSGWNSGVFSNEHLWILPHLELCLGMYFPVLSGIWPWSWGIYPNCSSTYVARVVPINNSQCTSKYNLSTH